MAVPPNVSSAQDLPPRGGYPRISLTRGIGPRGPSGAMIWAGVIGATIFGYIQLGRFNKEKRHLHKEKREVRMMIFPYLLAEQDKFTQKKIDDAFAEEAAIMKDVPGWEPGQSTFSKRWSAPRYLYNGDQKW